MASSQENSDSPTENVANENGEEGSPSSSVDVSALMEDGKNSKTIYCERCGSKILLPGKAEHVSKEIFLPYMKKKSEKQKPTDGEVLKDHWVVPDMFTFENVGFTLTVDNAKFLICADCEIGPVGWHDLGEKDKFFVALDRVKHE